ncbi:MAG TPA: ABC transporter permease [Candidatus Sulfomarinibacteraceae bacterium]|nr:ABC transporter permease [Candidatus Sulfomarinibacteraceae bacterium]
MSTILNIARLTIHETQRRRILWVALFMGVAFLVVFGLGFHYIFVEIEAEELRGGSIDIPLVIASFLTLAGLYVINFLVIVIAALLSAGTISGELESHTMETIVTKPIRRWEVVLGKWLGLTIIITVYLLALAGGVLLIAYLRVGFRMPGIAGGLGLMLLAALTMLSLSLLGGTRLSTLANGSLAFMLYAVAYVGGWVEQIGALLRNETAVDLGILSSLLMPADVLWKKASLLFNPQLGSGPDFPAPFVVLSQPNEYVVYYAVFYATLLLVLAVWSFSRRDL